MQWADFQNFATAINILVQRFAQLHIAMNWGFKVECNCSLRESRIRRHINTFMVHCIAMCCIPVHRSTVQQAAIGALYSDPLLYTCTEVCNAIWLSTKDQTGKKQTPEASKIGNRLDQSIVTSHWIILERPEKNALKFAQCDQSASGNNDWASQLCNVSDMCFVCNICAICLIPAMCAMCAC